MEASRRTRGESELLKRGRSASSDVYGANMEVQPLAPELLLTDIAPLNDPERDPQQTPSNRRLSPIGDRDRRSRHVDAEQVFELPGKLPADEVAPYSAGENTMEEYRKQLRQTTEDMVRSAREHGDHPSEPSALRSFSGPQAPQKSSEYPSHPRLAGGVWVENKSPPLAGGRLPPPPPSRPRPRPTMRRYSQPVHESSDADDDFQLDRGARAIHPERAISRAMSRTAHSPRYFEDVDSKNASTEGSPKQHVISSVPGGVWVRESPKIEHSSPTESREDIVSELPEGDLEDQSRRRSHAPPPIGRRPLHQSQSPPPRRRATIEANPKSRPEFDETGSGMLPGADGSDNAIIIEGDTDDVHIPTTGRGLFTIVSNPKTGRERRYLGRGNQRKAAPFTERTGARRSPPPDS